MDRLSRCTVALAACDAGIAAVAALILIFAFSHDPVLALNLAGSVALAFCLRLIHRLSRLQEKGICHTDIWQALTPDELPHDASAIRRAEDGMTLILLRFAKTAAGAAVLLFGAAFLLSLN